MTNVICLEMMCMKIGLNKIFISFAMIAGVALADPIPTEALSQGGLQMRDNHLRDIGLVMRSGRGGFVDLGYTYTPSSEQVQLKSKFGVHDGFVFRHHYGMFGSWMLDSTSHLGFLTWFDRAGWDTQDFFFFPHYGKPAHIASVLTWGFSYTNTAHDFTAALGLQHQNLEIASERYYANESDSLLFYWGHARYKAVSFQGSFYGSTFQTLRLSLDLESRALYGGVTSGFKTYLPNLAATVYRRKDGEDDKNFVRLNWEQNLYKQILYADVSYDFPSGGFRSALLKFYPVPSRLVAIEASCLRRNELGGSKELLWGGAIDLCVLRLAYNSAYDYDNMFRTKGTFVVELHLNLGSLDGQLFGRGAPQAAPMETTTNRSDLKKFLRNYTDQTQNKTTFDAQGNKVIEAKGIRYEKTGSTSAEGGK